MLVAINVTATQPAKAMAACPEGRPPLRAVPRPASALTAMVATKTIAKATTVRSIGDSRTRASTVYGAPAILS